MRCFGEFKNDRTCDLCGVVNSDTRMKCEKTKKEAEYKTNRIWNISSNCLHRRPTYDRYESYYECLLKGNGEECHPTLECENL